MAPDMPAKREQVSWTYSEQPCYGREGLLCEIKELLSSLKVEGRNDAKIPSLFWPPGSGKTQVLWELSQNPPQGYRGLYVSFNDLSANVEWEKYSPTEALAGRILQWSGNDEREVQRWVDAVVARKQNPLALWGAATKEALGDDGKLLVCVDELSKVTLGEDGRVEKLFSALTTIITNYKGAILFVTATVEQALLRKAEALSGCHCEKTPVTPLSLSASLDIISQGRRDAVDDGWRRLVAQAWGQPLILYMCLKRMKDDPGFDLWTRPSPAFWNAHFNAAVRGCRKQGPPPVEEVNEAIRTIMGELAKGNPPPAHEHAQPDGSIPGHFLEGSMLDLEWEGLVDTALSPTAWELVILRMFARKNDLGLAWLPLIPSTRIELSHLRKQKDETVEQFAGRQGEVTADALAHLQSVATLLLKGYVVYSERPNERGIEAVTYSKTENVVRFIQVKDSPADDWKTWSEKLSQRRKDWEGDLKKLEGCSKTYRGRFTKGAGGLKYDIDRGTTEIRIESGPALCQHFNNSGTRSVLYTTSSGSPHGPVEMEVVSSKALAGLLLPLPASPFLERPPPKRNYLKRKFAEITPEPEREDE